MTATTIGTDLYERLVDRPRHGLQYSEAPRVLAEDALDVLEAIKREEVEDDGESAS